MSETPSTPPSDLPDAELVAEEPLADAAGDGAQRATDQPVPDLATEGTAESENTAAEEAESTDDSQRTDDVVYGSWTARL